MADTAITLVSIAVGVYIAAVSALLGSPYAKELKQETDKKKTGNTLLGTLQDYFRCAGKFGVVTIIVSCLYCIPSTYIIPARIMRIGSAIAYGVFSCNILFLWLLYLYFWLILWKNRCDATGERTTPTNRLDIIASVI